MLEKRKWSKSSSLSTFPPSIREKKYKSSSIAYVYQLHESNCIIIIIIIIIIIFFLSSSSSLTLQLEETHKWSAHAHAACAGRASRAGPSAMCASIRTSSLSAPRSGWSRFLNERRRTTFAMYSPSHAARLRSDLGLRLDLGSVDLGSDCIAAARAESRSDIPD